MDWCAKPSSNPQKRDFTNQQIWDNNRLPSKSGMHQPHFLGQPSWKVGSFGVQGIQTPFGNDASLGRRLPCQDLKRCRALLTALNFFLAKQTRTKGSGNIKAPMNKSPGFDSLLHLLARMSHLIEQDSPCYLFACMQVSLLADL